ncbi:MAG: DUF4906 domain-containing protein [Prevotella sp.]|jgi:hypothetical protein|nr:DUF4906 domain-containing protein [Prevotella sp.]
MKKIHIIYRYLLVALVIMAFVSCSENIVSENTGNTEGKEYNIQIKTNIVSPVEDNLAEGSRAITADNETHISNLHLLAFNVSGKMVANGYVDYEALHIHNHSTFVYSLGVNNANQNLTVYGIANIDNKHLFDDHTITKQVFDSLYVKAEDAFSLVNGTYNIYKKGGEFLCEVKNQTSPILISPATTVHVEADGTTAATIQLVRQCAKVTINIDPREMKVHAYQLRHIPTIAYLRNNEENYANPEFSDVPTHFVENDEEAITGITYYVYENYNEANANIDAAKKRNYKNAATDASYVNIWTKYNTLQSDEANPNGIEMSSMYRVYLGGVNADDEQDITEFSVKRNHNYTYNVVLKGDGSADDRTVTGTMKPNIGDYLFNDGTWGKLVKITDKRWPVAVVFSNETTETDKNAGYFHGYAMALKNVHNGDAIGTYTWGPATDVADIPNVDNVWSHLSMDRDGLTHSQKINNPTYPAAYAATTTYEIQEAAPVGTSGWFLGSTGQWFDLFRNVGGATGDPNNYWGWGTSITQKVMDIINAKLNFCDDTTKYDLFVLNDGIRHWTSTEYTASSAYNSIFSTAANLYFAWSEGKTAARYARPFIAF